MLTTTTAVTATTAVTTIATTTVLLKMWRHAEIKTRSTTRAPLRFYMHYDVP